MAENGDVALRERAETAEGEAARLAAALRNIRDMYLSGDLQAEATLKAAMGVVRRALDAAHG